MLSINPVTTSDMLPFLYVGGLQSSYASTTTISVAAGACRDSLNQIDIQFATATTVSISTSGLNGIDVGTVAASSDYALWAINSPTNYHSDKPNGYVLSLSFTAPTLPSGYTAIRRIGAIKTNSSSQVVIFYSKGSSREKLYQWDAPITVRASATVTTSFVAVPLTAGMPPLAIPVILGGVWTPNAAADTLFVRPTGSTSTNGVSLASGDVAAVAHVIAPIAPFATALATGAPSVDVKGTSASDTLALTVVGYIDIL